MNKKLHLSKCVIFISTNLSGCRVAARLSLQQYFLPTDVFVLNKRQD